MKELYIRDILIQSVGSEITLLGWVGAKRCQGKCIFFDVYDSTGMIQVIIEKEIIGENQFSVLKELPLETAVSINGLLKLNRNKKEINTVRIFVVGKVTKNIFPPPHSKIDIFSEKLTDHLLKNRHLYLRNPKTMAILRARDSIMRSTRDWFFQNNFLSIDAPILTPVPLYEDNSAIKVNINGDNVFLTQCVGYYLEAAVHSFERVYNMGPSFRGEESRSKRHLMEYWHIKAEIAWANLDDIINLVENLIKYVLEKSKEDLLSVSATLKKDLCFDGLDIPFYRITYEEATKLLILKKINFQFGKSLSSKEEMELSKIIGKPFWVTGIPRKVEPFPYVVDSLDSRITRVADLIASNGYGELLGTAEKIHNFQMLIERMQEKGKENDPRYQFVKDIHQIGCVPHAAFGMGVERFIRWILNIPHVKDAIPFPRIFRRKISP